MTYTVLETIGLQIALPKLREAVDDDLLISDEEMISIAQYVAENIIDYIDIESDGTVRIASGAVEELFGYEMNIGQSFYWGEYAAFLREWGANANPDLLKKLTEVNVRNNLPENSALSGEKLGAFIAAVAARLEKAYEKHFSEGFDMYVQIYTEEMLIMKNAVIDITEKYADAFVGNAEETAKLIAAYELPDFSKSFREWTDEQKQSAGL